VLLTLVLVAVSVTATYAVTRLILLPRRKPDYEGATGKWPKEAEVRTDELQECLAQQAATSEILRVISGSPPELQPVLEAVAERAARLTAATDSQLYLVDGASVRRIARHGPLPVDPAADRLPISRDFVTGKAILDRCVVQVTDLLAAEEHEFAASREIATRTGIRTVLCVPMLREAVSVGVIAIRRTAVQPFTERQIELLKTFADQAVIAIENARLFKELEERNKSLSEALEQQTATSEILRVISSSPTDLQPVLDALAQSAARLCDARDANVLRVEGEHLRVVSHYGVVPTVPTEERFSIQRDSLTGRSVIERRALHVTDLLAESDAEFGIAKAYAVRFGYRTSVAVPLLREGNAIGVIIIRRTEVRAFSERQIELLKTFADQAVIAIENVRLFQELQTRTQELAHSVDQYKALAEVGQAVN